MVHLALIVIIITITSIMCDAMSDASFRVNVNKKVSRLMTVRNLDCELGISLLNYLPFEIAPPSIDCFVRKEVKRRIKSFDEVMNGKHTRLNKVLFYAMIDHKFEQVVTSDLQRAVDAVMKYEEMKWPGYYSKDEQDLIMAVTIKSEQWNVVYDLVLNPNGIYSPFPKGLQEMIDDLIVKHIVDEEGHSKLETLVINALEKWKGVKSEPIKLIHDHVTKETGLFHHSAWSRFIARVVKKKWVPAPVVKNNTNAYCNKEEEDDDLLMEEKDDSLEEEEEEEFMIANQRDKIAQEGAPEEEEDSIASSDGDASYDSFDDFSRHLFDDFSLGVLFS